MTVQGTRGGDQDGWDDMARWNREDWETKADTSLRKDETQAGEGEGSEDKGGGQDANAQ